MENTRYDYSAITKRDAFELPGKARVALWLGINIEYFDIGGTEFATAGRFDSPPPDVFDYAPRDYGNRVGIWRLMELLDHHHLKASVLLNSDVCEHYPIIVEEGRKRDWEFLGHCTSNSILLGGKGEAEERSIISTTLHVIEKSCGQRPLGWLSPALQETFNTPDILSEEGVKYVCDWCCDDQPFPMNVKKGTMISVPYSLELNDIPAFIDHHLTPAQFREMIVDQFDTLYREGAEQARVMCIALHPFLIGQPFRIGWLDKALKYIKGHEDVWFVRSRDIAAWYYEKYLGLPFP
jgi:allantoinase